MLEFKEWRSEQRSPWGPTGRPLLSVGPGAGVGRPPLTVHISVTTSGRCRPSEDPQRQFRKQVVTSW